MSVPCYPSGTKEWMYSGVVTGDFTASTPVFMAVMTYDVEPERAGDDWYEAEWHGDTGKARVKYGDPDNGIAPLAEGRYVIWVKPVTATEEPLIRSGLIRIT